MASVDVDPTTDQRLRLRLYLWWLVLQGAKERWGPDWETADPQRRPRLEEEMRVIGEAGFEGAFVILADVLAFCRREEIPYGPGRGSVGGSLVCYCAQIHDVDPIEWGLLFERFMNPDRVSFPDVDLDISQRRRQEVIDYVVSRYSVQGQVVLRIGAFTRAGGRAIVDAMLAAMAPVDPNAGATATNLKKCFPEKGNITGGLKVRRELAWWLENGHGKRSEFRQIAEQAGWLDNMLKLDGMFQNLTKHAAGTVLLREEDLPYLPLTSAAGDKGERVIETAYDMYSLDDLGYPKWDFLGLRTLDVIVDAHKLLGGSGRMRDLLAIWQEHRDDPEPYEQLRESTTGIFQADTPGFQKTIREMQPNCFEHLVQLGALYRPGALDYQDESGRNMVEIFIDRMRGREPVVYAHPLLRPILDDTHGIVLYQEQAMRIVRDLGGFTRGQADSLRKAIGKKRPQELAKLRPLWEKGTAERGIPKPVADAIFENIEAAGRYSWNKSHATEYGIIMWWTCWFMSGDRRAAGFAAEINSLSGDRDKQANTVSVARQTVHFRPPDINKADAGFGIEDGEIVFGLAGIKGLGDANRTPILIERALGGPYASYEDFCRRLPSMPTNMKASLVACGAFDRLGEDRLRLLSEVPKGVPAWWVRFHCGHTMRKQQPLREDDAARCGECKATMRVAECTPIQRKRWQVLEHVNEDAKRALEGKPPKGLPPMIEWVLPTDADIAAGEMAAMGYYITNVPLADVTADLGRLPATYTGGEVHSLKVKPDRNGHEMAHIQLTTPALTRQRVLVFSSNWPQLQDKIAKGAHLIFRGRVDGDAYLADACWPVGRYDHFHKIKVTQPDGITETRPFDGRAETVRTLESSGCRVRLL